MFTNTSIKVASVTFDNANSSYIIAGAGTVTLESNSVNAGLTVSQGTHEFQARVDLGSNTDASVVSGATIEFNNRLSLNGNTLTKTGAGTLVIGNSLSIGDGVPLPRSTSARRSFAMI